MDSEDLAHYIRANKITARIVRLDQPTPTVEAAALAVGVASNQIVKSVLFMVRGQTGSLDPLLVISNGTRQVDQKKVAEYLGIGKKRVRLANEAQVEAATGYPVGTVPPFGHPQLLPTLIERQVVQQREIYAGGGAINALVYLTVAELQRVLQAKVVDLAKE